MSLTENTDVFAFVSAKLRCHVLFEEISDPTKVDLYHVVAIENSESKKFFNLASHFVL